MRSPAQQSALAKARAAARPKKGEANGAAKLNDNLVRKIRRLRESGERPSVLAARFCVDRGVIWRVLTRRNWSHV